MVGWNSFTQELFYSRLQTPCQTHSYFQPQDIIFFLTVLHTELGHNMERQAAVAMDLDSLVDMDHQDIVSIIPGDPMLQVLHDQVKPFHFSVR